MYHHVLGSNFFFILETIHRINQRKVILFRELNEKPSNGLYLHQISSCFNHNK